MIDTNNWKRFLLHELFDIAMGSKFDMVQMTFDNSRINFVGRSASNNGVAGTVDVVPDAKIYPAGDISLALGGSLGTACLQNKPFYTSQNVAVLHAKEELSAQVKLFICSIIMFECRTKYVAFGRELNKHVRRDFELYLPADSDGNPNWAWMEQYMDSLSVKPITTAVKSSKMPLGIESWKEFHLGDWFEVRKGKRLTSEDQELGEVPYIGAIDSNNGVANHIAQDPIHEGNTISLSYNGSVGEAFYQPEAYWSTDDVNALYLKDCARHEMNEMIGLFVATVLRQEKYRFSYGRKWTLPNMRDAIVKLPADDDGNPNWAWMEQYMKSLPYSDRIA
ncbi:MAG: restriction endonuclease subunit S [Aeriscardovia sp.]|nr:restriction endonuclease subunit S [Aeriscardovia sp.]